MLGELLNWNVEGTNRNRVRGVLTGKDVKKVSSKLDILEVVRRKGTTDDDGERERMNVCGREREKEREISKEWSLGTDDGE